MYYVKDRPLCQGQRRVLQLVAEGMTNRQIAAALNLSHYTVKAHMEHIQSRLGTTDRAGSVMVALRRGYIT